MNSYLYFYFAEFLLIFFGGFFRIKHFLHLSVIFAIFFSGIRFNVGVDYENYILLFSNAFEQELTLYEPTTVIFSRLLYISGLGSWLIFFIYSLITVSCIYFYVRKFSPSPALSLFLFLTIPIYYLSSFNGVRQWTAISLYSIALVFLSEEKRFKVFISILAASMFHFSAFFLFLLTPFLKHRYSPKFILMGVIIIVVSLSFFVELVRLTPYEIYLEKLRFEKKPSLIFLLYIIFLVFFPWVLGYFDSRKVIGGKVIILCNMCFASIVVLCAGYKLDFDFLTLMRINAYFIIQMPVLIAFLVEFRCERNLRLVGYFAVISLSIVYLAYTLFFNGYKYKLTPYQSWIF